MPLDSRYSIAPTLEQYYVDKDTGLPLAAGTIEFFSNISRSAHKPVYKYDDVSGTYIALPNPSTLSDVGTFQDGGGNNIIPFYYTFQGAPEDNLTTVELYYIVVKNSDGVLQFTRDNWPPGAAGGIINTGDDSENFIPNGQFLFHNTTFPTSSLITELETPLAQGGWYFHVGSQLTVTGTYNVTFTQFTALVSGIDDFPRYAIDIEATNRVNDDIQDLQIRWSDVNKFCLQTGTAENDYTLFFNAQTNDGGAYTIDVYRTKYFGTGGSPSGTLRQLIGSHAISTAWTSANLTFTFGNNDAFTVGTNNDDYVALDFHVRGSTGFDIRITDVALVFGTQVLSAFPLKTDAEMKTEGIAGFMPIPNPDGSDLYLPLKLSPTGLLFDNSEIGNIVLKTTTTEFTNSISTETNEILADGNGYIVSGDDGYSPLGIPYYRLRDKWYNSTTFLPTYGTGYQYLTAYVSAKTGTLNELRITTNKPQASITITSDGAAATGFTFSVISSNAAAPPGVAYNSAANTLTFISNTVGTSGLFTEGATATNFTFTAQRNSTGAGTTTYFINNVTTVAPAAMGGGVNAAFFTFVLQATTYKVYFPIDGVGAAPAGGAGITLIRVDLRSTDTAAEVAYKMQDGINGWQSSRIVTLSAAGITTGDYFNIYAGSTNQQFVVWYNKDSGGGQPVVASAKYIEVAITTGDTDVQVAAATRTAVNRNFVGTPNLQGLFLRGYDPTQQWDMSALTRLNLLDGQFGNNLGTIEFDLVLSHSHTYLATQRNDAGGGASPFQEATGTGGITTVTQLHGNAENRPVNANVNYAIKY